MKGLVRCVAQDGNVTIPEDITVKIGSCLKSTNMNNVMLLITSLNDDRFPGEPLSSNGSEYCFPAEQMSALGIKSGDKVKLVFSEELGFIIMQKRGAEI